MADTFEDLGIAPDLVAGAEQMGWEAPTGLQHDAVPVVRRGNNLVLHASAGSGLVGAYGLGVLDRLLGDDDRGLRALVLVPDTDAASDTAESLARLAANTRLTVRADAAGWSTGDADLLVATAAAATAAVRDSSLKLGGIRTLIIDGADQLADTGQGSDVETLVDAIPGPAQRILVTGRLDATMDDFAERHVRRAMTVPPRPVDATEREPVGPALRYTVVAEDRKTTAVVQLLASMSAPEVAVVCRTRDRAARVGRELTARGVGDADDPADARVRVLPRLEADRRSTRALVLSYDVPFESAELLALHGKGGAVIATPRERAHLARIARRAARALEPVTTPEPSVLTATEALRERLRSAMADDDLAAELALLEPLLAEHPAAEVAAAAIRLLRRSPGPRQTPARPGAGSVPGSAGASAPPPPGGRAWVHLFMSVGSRDGVGPGDVVGAITGEAGVTGDQVGRIDIRESHTTVDVATEVAGRVIESLNGRTLKGRSLRVDYDRKERVARKSPGRRPRTGGRGKGGGPGGPARDRSGGRR